MYSNTAVRSLSIVGHGRVWVSSFLRVAKNDSATALSKQIPVRPTEGRTPLSPAEVTELGTRILTGFNRSSHRRLVGVIVAVPGRIRLASSSQGSCVVGC